MAADPHQRGHPAAVYRRRAALGRPPARGHTPTTGNECRDERSHERDTQHRRRVADQIVWTRKKDEDKRFSERAWAVREMDVQSSVIGCTVLCHHLGLVTAVGTALVYGFGGYFVIQKAFTIGTMVAFGSYLGTLYNTLQSLSNAPVTFSTSVVSFERVF